MSEIELIGRQLVLPGVRLEPTSAEIREEVKARLEYLAIRQEARKLRREKRNARKRERKALRRFENV